MAADIFSKRPELKPAAMATVAERRFEDAKALCDTGKNSRANGAAYLVGFVSEILLKARLVEKWPNIARKRQHEVADAEQQIWRLIWRQHDLEVMLAFLPDLVVALKKRGERDHHDYAQDLKKLCATWTIQARYSPNSILLKEARDMLDRIRRLKELLK